MVVTTRRRAAAIKKSGQPEMEPAIENDTTTKRSVMAKNIKSSTVVDHKDTTVTKPVSEPTMESGTDKDDSASDDSSNNEDSSSDDDNSENEKEYTSDEDQDDDDLDDLLAKAQTALRKQQDSIIKLDDDQKNSSNLQFPKLQPGISVADELYIKANKDGISKLSSQSVAVIDSDTTDQDTKNPKALVSLKKIKEESKPLSRKERQLEREKTAGKGWFDMPLADVTPEIKRDLQILRMRHVLDRKRHYKKMGKGSDPKYFQMGTVIEGATEFFSSRINKKDRKRTFAEEILSSSDQNDYYYRKYQESQARKASGGKKNYKRLMTKRS